MRESSGKIERRFGVRTAYSAAELALVALTAFAAAVLFWAVLAPIGPLGVWRANVTVPTPAAANFSGLDPLFGFQQDGGPLEVSTSGLILYGVRMDQASGRGSAFLGEEGEPQDSFAVGEEVAPGLVLARVERDHVVLSRGGAEEVLFLDESEPAARVGPDSSTPPPGRFAGRRGPGADDLVEAINLSAREGGQSGLLIEPAGNGDMFRRSGLRSGDVLFSLNGTPATDPAEVERTLRTLRSGATVTLIVERRGARIPLSVRVP